MQEYLIIIFLILGAVFLLFWLTKKQKNQDDSVQKIFHYLEQDRKTRFQENESIRKELRDTTKNLQEQFFKVNKTVDTKLSESTKQLNDRLDKSSQVIGHLNKELGKIGEIGSKIETLDKILRSPKGRGNMGEENLEEILRSVFPPNLWERQFSIAPNLIVDAVIKTTNGLIPIDAKFPLPAFESFVKAENEEERLRYQKEFYKHVKSRINEVSKYIRPDNGTLNFAILFLPNENVYYEAAIRSSEIPVFAKTKKVLLTGPNTMLYVLQMLFQAYQSQKFAQEAQKALEQISGVKVQAQKLDENINILGRHLGNATSKLSDVDKENQKLQGQIEKVALLKS